MLHYYLQTWKKGRSFTGRARRKEYWIFQSGTVLLLIGVAFAWLSSDVVRAEDARYKQCSHQQTVNSVAKQQAWSADTNIADVIKGKRPIAGVSADAGIEPITVRSHGIENLYSEMPVMTDGTLERLLISFGAVLSNNPFVNMFDTTKFKPNPAFDTAVEIVNLRDNQGVYLDDKMIEALRETASKEEFDYVLDTRRNLAINEQAQSLNLGVAFLVKPYGILVLLIMIVSVAVGVRRLHDVGKSGWFILIGLVPIVNVYVFYLMLIKKGDVGDNQYGPDPKNED